MWLTEHVCRYIPRGQAFRGTWSSPCSSAWSCGVVIAFGLEALDTTVRTPEQAESISGLPILGVIPLQSALTERLRVSARAHLLKKATAQQCRPAPTDQLSGTPVGNCGSLSRVAYIDSSFERFSSAALHPGYEFSPSRWEDDDLRQYRYRSSATGKANPAGRRGHASSKYSQGVWFKRSGWIVEHPDR